PYLYDLVSDYPSRLGKGLRPALCFATCTALGGNRSQALNSAAAIELLHNAFLVHDDVQDGSDVRRGSPTLLRQHGVSIAVNVGNATNLLALRRLMENRDILGAEASWLIMQETERMMTHSLEGQAIELAWIRDNTRSLSERDYLQMCLKKTSWYSFIYPMRVGALVARPGKLSAEQFCRLGWYFGAAFQIRDDILNLTADYLKYGKEIAGDLWEGKRTLMLIHLQQQCTEREAARLQRFLGRQRAERTAEEVHWVYELMLRHGSIDFARRAARQLAGAALLEALAAFRGLPDTAEKQFILEMILYVVNRDR
ncbi:MAG TPA: polyprenyl synthetase family protein, partial [Candidatus Angelobacter sp.]|nr:polyprenyl synthetase family protein [Candidatus Angelobacter sp.]